MDLIGRPMKGFVFVGPTGTKSEKDLAGWIEMAVEFNKRAKASKNKALYSVRISKLSEGVD